MAQRSASASASTVWDWPHRHYAPGDTFLEDVLGERKYGRRLSSQPIVKALTLWRLARDGRTLVLGASGVTTALYLALAAIKRPSREPSTILLHFLPSAASTRGLGVTLRARLIVLAKTAYQRIVLRRALNSVVKGAHVLSSWEVAEYEARFKLAEGTIKFIPWPLLPSGHIAGHAEPGDTSESFVLASGRASCDWVTVGRIFSKLCDVRCVIVCSKVDETLVREANQNAGTEILVDISQDEHFALMSKASVYLLALREDNVSSGHIRLSDAVRAGTPVVASRVRSLCDYLGADDDEAWLTFTPADPDGGARQITKVLDDRSFGKTLSLKARAQAEKYTTNDYTREIREWVRELEGRDGLASSGRPKQHR